MKRWYFTYSVSGGNSITWLNSR